MWDRYQRRRRFESEQLEVLAAAEGTRFGQKVYASLGTALEAHGWHLNIGACSVSDTGYAVLFEKDFVDHEIWFLFDPRSGQAESRIPAHISPPLRTYSEDEAVAYFNREVEAAIEATEGTLADEV